MGEHMKPGDEARYDGIRKNASEQTSARDYKDVQNYWSV